MPQSRERHAIYVAVKRKHPTWPPDLVKTEVSRIEGAQVHKKKDHNIEVHKGSQKGRIPGMKKVDGMWLKGTLVSAECPVCLKINTVDASNSYRPVDRCVHFQQLESPGKFSSFLFNVKARATTCTYCDSYKTTDLNKLQRHVEKYCTARTKRPEVHKGSQENKDHNPEVHNGKDRYLLSYSRNKYQYTLYFIGNEGVRSLVRSCKKGEKLNLGDVEIELTWGPETVESLEAQR